MLIEMVRFSAELTRYSDRGYDRVEILGRGDCCAACKKIPRRVPITAAPMLLLWRCPTPNGCLCSFTPVLAMDEESG